MNRLSNIAHTYCKNRRKQPVYRNGASYAIVRRSLLLISPMQLTTSAFIALLRCRNESLLLWLAPFTINADAVPPIATYRVLISAGYEIDRKESMIFTIMPSLRSSIIVMSIGAMKIGISRGSTGSRSHAATSARRIMTHNSMVSFIPGYVLPQKYRMYRISSVASISTTASMPAAKP